MIFTKRLFIKSKLSPHYAGEDDLYFYLNNKETFEEVGYICFQNINFKSGICDLAYKTYFNYRKNGYMKEALPILINYIFNIFPITSIYVDIKKENEASLNTIKCINNLRKRKGFINNDYEAFSIRKGEADGR